MKSPKKVGKLKSRNIVAGRVREARMAFAPPLTQDQLSGRLAVRRLSLDRVAITKIEAGNRCVFDFELPVLAEVLQVDVRWLLGIQASGGPGENSKKGAKDEL